MDRPPRTPSSSLRIAGLVALGAWFGGVAGGIAGSGIALAVGFDLVETVMRSGAGGLLGGSSAMLIAAAFGAQKARRLDRMHSACFSGAFGEILGGLAGIGALDVLSFATGREAGLPDRIGNDLLIILFIASAVGSIAVWAMSRLVTDEKKLQWTVFVLFGASVGIYLFITPAALAFGVGGAMAGFVSQPLLVARNTNDTPADPTSPRDGPV
jgi:hypothetical protein